MKLVNTRNEAEQLKTESKELHFVGREEDILMVSYLETNSKLYDIEKIVFFHDGEVVFSIDTGATRFYEDFGAKWGVYFDLPIDSKRKIDLNNKNHFIVATGKKATWQGVEGALYINLAEFESFELVDGVTERNSDLTIEYTKSVLTIVNDGKATTFENITDSKQDYEELRRNLLEKLHKYDNTEMNKETYIKMLADVQKYATINYYRQT